jgi:hypothetical protein
MNGRNLFESRSQRVFGTMLANTGSQPGVFISHSHLDQDKAREVADALRASRVDYHLDEENEELRIPNAPEKHAIVVQV